MDRDSGYLAMDFVKLFSEVVRHYWLCPRGQLELQPSPPALAAPAPWKPSQLVTGALFPFRDVRQAASKHHLLEPPRTVRGVGGPEEVGVRALSLSALGAALGLLWQRP